MMKFSLFNAVKYLIRIFNLYYTFSNALFFSVSQYKVRVRGKSRSTSHAKKLVILRVSMSYTNRFPPTKNTRYRSSWGPSSVSVFHRADVPRLSAEEEEYAEFYHERLHSAQSRQLIPLQEDLADWINKTISKFIVVHFYLLTLY
jgi:hypothetical protein